ncbi:S8 family serine peptidase [Larkinella sp.]|uniref:S8 family serine peptidase n=1 Tax=Larkinella sp. TaxID=2034517 RepID=UPI003BAA4ABE
MPQTIPPLLEELLKKHQPRVIIKFDASVKLPYQDGAEKALLSQKIGHWDVLQKKIPGVSLKKIFDPETEKCYRDLIDVARIQKPSEPVPGFFNYFYVDVPHESDLEELIKTLLTWEIVETAYREGIWVPADPNPFDRNPSSGQQEYLDAAPKGIDARFAQRLLQGDGTGIRVAHIDTGWLLTHQDLYRTTNGITQIPSVGAPAVYQALAHGTGALGIMAATDNEVGGVGISPNALYGVAGTETSYGSMYYGALAAASNWCMNRPGSIIVITKALFRYSDWGRYHHYVPVESEPMVFETISHLISRNICVISAAGQYADYGIDEVSGAGLNLDIYEDERGNRIYNRSIRDSGAILVAASTSGDSHRRLARSNYGNRIDCYAWGEKIYTPGDPINQSNPGGYNTSFGGTSGATAIVAGAAAVVQGLAKAFRPEGVFTPAELRGILSNPSLNTRSVDPPVDRIGVMPDLKKIAETYHLVNFPVEYSPSFREALADMERMKRMLAFAWQIIGQIGFDGPGWLIPGRFPGGLPIKVDPWVGPFTEIQKGMSLIQLAETFTGDEASSLRAIGVETIRKAAQVIEKG